MKISNFIAGSFIAFNSIAAFSLSANAGYSCSTDYFGNETCSGTMNGQRINTTSSTDYFGNTTTTGTVGGKSFNQTCSTDYFGNTNCN